MIARCTRCGHEFTVVDPEDIKTCDWCGAPVKIVDVSRARNPNPRNRDIMKP
jgi:rRNA maturation endonuclease Nob1